MLKKVAPDVKEGFREMSSTLSYYDSNAEDFAASTVSVDFSDAQERFLARLDSGSKILDFGCGSGRDAKYFLDRGFAVDASDGSSAMCRVASEYLAMPVKHELFQDLSDFEVYDGIWACASILHEPKADLPGLFGKLARALKPDGVIYASFKYGDFEGERNGRYFTCLTEESLAELLADVPALGHCQTWVSSDVREGRGDELWLNCLISRS